MIATSKALYNGGKVTWFSPRSEHLQTAQKEAESAIKLADQILLKDPENKDVRHLRAILFVNWTQIIQEQVKAKFPNLSGKVMSISEMRRLFRKIDALGQLKKVVETLLARILLNQSTSARLLHEPPSVPLGQTSTFRGLRQRPRDVTKLFELRYGRHFSALLLRPV